MPSIRFFCLLFCSMSLMIFGCKGPPGPQGESGQSDHTQPWSTLTGVPPGFADGVDNGIETEADPTVNVLAKADLNACELNDVPKSDGAGSWGCAPDINTTLDETAVDAFVSNNGYAMAVDTDAIATQIIAAQSTHVSLADRFDAIEARLAELESAAYQKPITGACQSGSPILSIDSDGSIICDVQNVLYGDVVVTNTNDLLEISAVTEITGGLRIFLTTLIDIQLPNLLRVGGLLQISGNSSLSEIKLPELITAGSIMITGNDSLTLLDLSSLEATFGVLQINGSSNLTTLALPALQYVAGNLQFFDLPVLTTLQLDKLQKADLGVSFERFEILDTLSLPSLRSVGNVVIIRMNGISTFNMPSLTLIYGGISIHTNNILQDLTGLNFLCGIGTNFYIADNPCLPTSQVTSLRDQVQACDGIGGGITINNNGTASCQ